MMLRRRIPLCVLHFFEFLLTMNSKLYCSLVLQEDGLDPVLPFDPAETEDLWFLPATGYDDAPVLAPLPYADWRQLFDPAECAYAQADLAAELAYLCQNCGIFAERLAGMAEGARQRLAILEAAEVSGWAGHRIGAGQRRLA